ncbi:MAG: type II toxin-antitoxin system RelE/ParE family toxin [Pseudomonadota bacterium]|nr:type II toxin-antitoxin system RelE/ParE family toxin [Pseudomonadota bacterium]
MRIFKNAWFQRFARKERIADAVLCDAADRAERGQVDADLGSGVLKQRVARPGSGKSGGYRTILFFRAGDRAVFVYGFAKSDRDNIDEDEEAAFKRAAKEVLALSEAQLNALVRRGRFVEVDCDGDKGKEVSKRGARSRP